MFTPLRSSSFLALGLFVALGLSISAVQAAQDGRGSGRGRGGNPRVKVSQEDAFFKICDHDKNQWISFREANYSLLLDRNQFGTIDKDSDGRITRVEFDAYYQESNKRNGAFREPRAKTGVPREPTRRGAPDKVEATEKKTPVNSSSVLEFFGARKSREEEKDMPMLPPHIRGPVHHFARLDIDEDGLITAKDLEWLERSTHLEVRFSAVIGILDTNDDGGISPEELDASLR